MSKVKKLLFNWRVILLIFMLLMSAVLINPVVFGNEGVAIRAISADSAAENAIPSFDTPKPNDNPRSREVITAINNQPITSEEDYHAFVEDLGINYTLRITTNKGQYTLMTQPNIVKIETGDVEIITTQEEIFDEELNQTINVTMTQEVPVFETYINGTADLGLQIYNAPKNNIKKGLDIAGGTRVILEPQEAVTPEQLDMILENIRQRLNVYGLSDIVVRSTSDFTGEHYILVEIAGASKDEVSSLLAGQGEFEAKVGDKIVFMGGDDIVYVDQTATGSGLDPQNPCQPYSDTWTCGFRFSISLSQEAARRQAAATKDLDVVYTGTYSYLSENLTLFLDGEMVNELRIGSDLQGNPVTDISISGSGSGPTREAAQQNALLEMKQMQAVLQTGSLPVQLDIIQIEAISPSLGEEFVKNALAVVATVLIRYKKPMITIPVIICMVSELIMILGFAVIANWQLDLVAIAGIIIAIGTGVDDQIVIIDETLEKNNRRRTSSWKSRLKNAFFIIMTAYFTTVVAMLPLLRSGAGLLKGFALTTIIGVTLGVLITRPAFAKILEVLLESSKKESDDEE
jgi:preprotein translocase subunit SecD